MQSFINYVLAFYGHDGVYDMGATRSMVTNTIHTYLNYASMQWFVPEWECNQSFGYDTLDRELIADLMIRDYGLVFPTN